MPSHYKKAHHYSEWWAIFESSGDKDQCPHAGLSLRMQQNVCSNCPNGQSVSFRNVVAQFHMKISPKFKCTKIYIINVYIWHFLYLSIV